MASSIALLCAAALIGVVLADEASSPAVVPFGDTGELHICTPSIVRVVHRPTAAPVVKESLIAKSQWDPVEYSSSQQGDLVIVETSELLVSANVSSGQVSFSRKGSSPNEVLLRERSREFTPVQDMGVNTYQVEQSWFETSPAEALYGGGSYQSGLLNFKNAPVQMLQFNTEAVVPFFTSSEGYGLLWDNYAWSFLNPPETVLVPAGSNDTGTTEFTPSLSGDHFFYWGVPFPREAAKPKWGSSSAMTMVKVELESPDGHKIPVISWDNLKNLPSSMMGRAEGLVAGTKYKVRYECDMKGRSIHVQGPEYGRTTLRSAIGDLVDYYFVLGHGDKAVAGYREITGAAPLYGRWVYGFWQCKEHYDAQDHVLEAAHGFRNRSIPVDSIVQDWHYWGNLGWGPQWDPTIYPDPAGMVQELKDMGIHLMVSVWSKFDAKTMFYQQMRAKGWMLGEHDFYDAWNPEARELFYNFSKESMFTKGVDSLWLDATEPEGFPNVDVKTYLGTGNAFMNTYSLATTSAISDGLRKDFPDAQGARVFSLTRSAFAGQQRTGASLWTGDISGDWDSLRRQVASSLNYALSGMPYWSEDIGGFFRPSDQYTSAGYHDLLTRWFQFGAFTPIFRVHGAGTSTELWNFGEKTMMDINASAISLRYRLLPYTYSGFARVDLEGYTMQRPLVLDFPEDDRVLNIADTFMWGDALLLAPILHPADPKCGCSTRSVYFPKAADWVNFHTGVSTAGGDASVSFALNEAPLFARAGSIVVLGPFLQRTADASSTDPLEVRVYPGADATFALWEDDGVSRAYQGGDFTHVNITWHEGPGMLTIGSQQGKPGQPARRSINVVFARPGHGVGVAPVSQPDATVLYEGKALSVKKPEPRPVYMI